MIMRTVRSGMRSEGGFALAAVIFVMAMLGVLAIAAMVTTGDARIADKGVQEGTRAFYAAEAGVNLTIADWVQGANYDTLMPNAGDSVDMGWQTISENGTYYRARMRRVSTNLYSLSAQGRSRGAGASQVQVLLRKAGSWNIGTTQAAVYAATELRKNSAQGVTTGYVACSSDSVAGLKTPYLQYAGDVTEVFNGAPPVDTVTNDPLAELQATGIDWPGILSSSFDYTILDETEFPDFDDFDDDYYPSIRVTGARIDLRDDHNGRGILVVTEELRINNDWEWDGVILVGNFFQSNGKMTINGTMMTGLNILLGVDPADIMISAIGPGQAQVTFDTCIISDALNATGGGGGLEVVDGSWHSIW